MRWQTTILSSGIATFIPLQSHTDNRWENSKGSGKPLECFSGKIVCSSRIRFLICHVADRADNQSQPAAKMHFKVQNKSSDGVQRETDKAKPCGCEVTRGRRLAEISGDQEGTQGGKKQSTRGSSANQRSGNVLFSSWNIPSNSGVSVSFLCYSCLLQCPASLTILTSTWSCRATFVIIILLRHVFPLFYYFVKLQVIAQ